MPVVCSRLASQALQARLSARYSATRACRMSSVWWAVAIWSSEVGPLATVARPVMAIRPAMLSSVMVGVSGAFRYSGRRVDVVSVGQLVVGDEFVDAAQVLAQD